MGKISLFSFIRVPHILSRRSLSQDKGAVFNQSPYPPFQNEYLLLTLPEVISRVSFHIPAYLFKASLARNPDLPRDHIKSWGTAILTCHEIASSLGADGMKRIGFGRVGTWLVRVHMLALGTMWMSLSGKSKPDE